MVPPRSDRTVFVTVGTTKFDALIRVVDQQAFADTLVAAGYTRLVMQIGRCACLSA
jgi:beta-1,4-N-acetylglucosaminyltransferase